MACGAPVICSDIPVHRELFNEAAIFFPATSADDLAMCIAKLANDVKQRTSAIGAGRLLALRYTWEGMADRMSNFYRGLLDKKLPPLK
jgi:glycosyltransferase involved in cell wall biosynthesis